MTASLSPVFWNSKALGRAVHIAVAAIGTYFVTNAMLAWQTLLLVIFFGMARSEAVVLTSMIGFLVYLALLIWGFAERNTVRLCAVLSIVWVASYVLERVLAPLMPISAFENI